MQTSAAGSRKPAAGFTLLELLVVVAIVAMASAGVSFSMRDASQVQLIREADRLAALLESARARSQVMGVAVRWRDTTGGFQFEGLAAQSLPEQWLNEDTYVVKSTSGEKITPYLQLGPEPVIEPQELILASRTQPGKMVALATDGVRPFNVKTAP
jgi:general secretion pathway protein H